MMPHNINFIIHAGADSSGQILGELEMRLKHPVFLYASINVEFDKNTHLPNSAQAIHAYRHYEIRATYVSPKGKIPDHIEVTVEIADYARDEVRTAIKNILLEVFNFQGD